MLTILVEEALRAGIEEIAVVVCPGDEAPYGEAAGAYSNRLRFVHQAEPRGYGHAIWCARDFVGDAPFLLVNGELHDEYLMTRVIAPASKPASPP